MHNGIEIRISRPGDASALEDLYRKAFPEEDVLSIAQDLLREESGVVSLVAVRDGEVAGHIAFTMCGIEGRSETVCMLAPLAVSPSLQRQGIGGALIEEGVKRMKAEGVTRVFVLGDPNYYGRFGFKGDGKVKTPYPLPDVWCDAWQSLDLDGASDFEGALVVPKMWRKAAYWAP